MAAASCPWPAAIILKRPQSIRQFCSNCPYPYLVWAILSSSTNDIKKRPGFPAFFRYREMWARRLRISFSFQNIAPSCTFSHCNRPEPILIKLEFLKLVVQQNENAARFLAIYFHRTACASSKFVGTGRSDRPSSVNSCCPGDWTAFNNPQQPTR
jgi:hypothetical protein